MESGDRIGPLTTDRYPTGSNLTGWKPSLLSKSQVLILLNQITYFKTPQSAVIYGGQHEVLYTGHFTIFNLRVDRQPLPSLHSPFNSAMRAGAHANYFTLRTFYIQMYTFLLYNINYIPVSYYFSIFK